MRCYVTLSNVFYLNNAYGTKNFLRTCWPIIRYVLLNQARAGRRPARAWFLKIDPVRIVGMRACVCVCVSAPEAINN